MGKESKKKRDRRYKIPVPYIEALAGNIVSTRPTAQILANTLVGFHNAIYARAYARRIADSKYFREKTEARFEQDWKNLRDYLDDIIHPEKKSQTKAKV